MDDQSADKKSQRFSVQGSRFQGLNKDHNQFLTLNVEPGTLNGQQTLCHYA
jgi:hypothetical protein